MNRRAIEAELGPIVIREGNTPRVGDCTNVGTWTGSTCMMPAEPGTDRCPLHRRES